MEVLETMVKQIKMARLRRDISAELVSEERISAEQLFGRLEKIPR